MRGVFTNDKLRIECGTQQNTVNVYEGSCNTASNEYDGTWCENNGPASPAKLTFWHKVCSEFAIVKKSKGPISPYSGKTLSGMVNLTNIAAENERERLCTQFARVIPKQIVIKDAFASPDTSKILSGSVNLIDVANSKELYSCTAQWTQQ